MDRFDIRAARARRWVRLASPLLLVCLVLAACGTNGASSTGHNLGQMTVGLTYFPDIQFAPFYVADALGYYKQAGLTVHFHHGIETNEFALLSAGKEDAIFAAGDEVLGARAASNLPLVDVATVFQKYPVALIVPADSPIHTPADLRGHSVGVPGPYGATYTGLLALLHYAGLSTSDVNIQSIGFTQVTALLTHKVDAVMGYSNNEAVQLQRQGFAVRALDVGNYQPMVSNGLVVLQSELQSHPAQVRALVSATLRGVQYAIQHPQETVRLSANYVPGLKASDQQASALAVLQATIPLMQATGKPGANDAAAWQSMASFLQSARQLKGDPNVAQAYSNAYLPS
jgi:NitT/TauT family transport system substrate-binding protein